MNLIAENTFFHFSSEDQKVRRGNLINLLVIISRARGKISGVETPRREGTPTPAGAWESLEMQYDARSCILEFLSKARGVAASH